MLEHNPKIHLSEVIFVFRMQLFRVFKPLDRITLHVCVLPYWRETSYIMQLRFVVYIFISLEQVFSILLHEVNCLCRNMHSYNVRVLKNHKEL